MNSWNSFEGGLLRAENIFILEAGAPPPVRTHRRVEVLEAVAGERSR